MRARFLEFRNGALVLLRQKIGRVLLPYEVAPKATDEGKERVALIHEPASLKCAFPSSGRFAATFSLWEKDAPTHFE